MAEIINDISRTFNEYLLLPNLTKKTNTPGNVNLQTPMAKYGKGDDSSITLNIPIVSAIMQSVSNDTLAIELARSGGLSFIYHSQPIDIQAQMINNVKLYKAGFIKSDSNIKPDNTLKDILALSKKTGHSTMAVTEDGSSNGRFLGIITSNDYRTNIDPMDKRAHQIMIPLERCIVGRKGISLSEANEIIWKNKLNCLPVVDENDNLNSLVFRKDIINHEKYPNEMLDKDKRLLVGAGINTRDYAERVPELIKAGADILCIDSSDGYSEWQRDTIKYVKKNYSDIPIGAGNVIDEEGFNYLAEAGADFVKIGIGGGSICITREQKGIGRGQASAVIAVSNARNRYYEKTKSYIPLCSDGGIMNDYHITLALAMGADFVMMGRYFARFDESPTNKIKFGNNYVKEYWAEGSKRASNWKRYNMGESVGLEFEEGVDCYVPYAGSLKSNIEITLTKIRSTFSNCGVNTIKELQKHARLVLVSSISIVEGKPHNILPKDMDERYK